MAKTSDKRKTKAQLIEELQRLRQQVAGLQELEKERKRAEEALRESEERYRSMVESIDIGLNLIDCDHNIVMVNAAQGRHFDKPPREMVGKKCFREFEKRDAVCSHCPGVQAIATGQPAEVETHGIRDDGSRFNVRLRAFPVFGQDGIVRGFIEVGQDITERKQAEEALAEERNLLRTLIDNLPDYIYIKDAESRFMMANMTVARLMGATTSDELLGKTDFDFYPHELAAQYYAGEQEIIRSGQPLVNREELLMDQVTGTRGWVSTTKVPLRDAQGKTIGFVGIGRDITERKLAEEALQKANEELERRALQLQAAAEVSRAASSILDPDELFQQVVELARQRFDLYYAGLFLVDEVREWAVLRAGTGEAGRKMLEQGHRLEVGGESMIGWCVANKQARIALDVGEEAVRFENPLLPETRSELALPLVSRGEAIGALTIQSAHEAAFSEEDIAALQTMADQLANAISNARLYEQAQWEIAERKRAEEALARQARALDAELEQFFYVASHHLQEPLRMVVSYSQFLERRYKGRLDEDADEIIAYAVDGATRIQALLNDVLTFARVTTRARPFVPTDCAAVLDRVLANLKVVIEESGAVVTHDDLPTVMADETQLTQVFQSLIGNAIKFRSDRPLQIHVGAERLPLPPAGEPALSGPVPSTVEGTEGGRGRGEWLFSVQDNGIGIEPRYFRRIFAIFQRLHAQDEYPGTGIGLAVCKKIVERHGGRIWVESQPGQGSTFYFTIPMTRR